MIQNAIVFSKSISLSKCLMLGTPLISYLGVEWATNSVGIGLIVSSFFTAVGVVANNRSKVISAKASALVTGTAAQDAHFANLVETMSRLHRQDIDYWKRQVEQQSKVEVLIRVTKHKALGAYYSATLIIRNLEEELKSAGVKFTMYQPALLTEITGQEDARMIVSMFPELVQTKELKQ